MGGGFQEQEGAGKAQGEGAPEPAVGMHGTGVAHTPG